MAEIKIDNLQAGQAANETLKQAITKLQTVQDTAKSGFDVLKTINPDMGSKFISELNGSLTDMMSFLNNIHSAAAAYFKNDEDPGDSSDYGRRSSPHVDPAPSTDPPPVTTPPTEAPTVPPEGKRIDTSALEKLKNSRA